MSSGWPKKKASPATPVASASARKFESLNRSRQTKVTRKSAERSVHDIKIELPPCPVVDETVRAGGTAAAGQVHQAEHQREPLSAAARGGRGDSEGGDRAVES